MSMTMHERMLAVMQGRPHDRVPFVQYDDAVAPNKEIWQLADHWLDEIDDWSLCDTLCVCLTGPMVAAHSSMVERLLEWSRSKSPWRRRAAVVSLRQLLNRGVSPGDSVLRLCERLMEDKS